jgi:hypothetical protein
MHAGTELTILISWLFSQIDGYVARRLKARSHPGRQRTSSRIDARKTRQSVVNYAMIIAEYRLCQRRTLPYLYRISHKNVNRLFTAYLERRCSRHSRFKCISLFIGSTAMQYKPRWLPIEYRVLSFSTFSLYCRSIIIVYSTRPIKYQLDSCSTAVTCKRNLVFATQYVRNFNCFIFSHYQYNYRTALTAEM